MHADLHLIKALRSEESITSVEAYQFEPDNCFNEDCLFPLGPACNDCVAAANAREELRQQILGARRSSRLAEDSDERQGAMSPTNEKLKADELSRYFEFGNDSLERIIESPQVSKPSSLLISARCHLRTLKRTQSVQSLKGTKSQASSQIDSYNSDSDSSDVTIIHSSEDSSSITGTLTSPTTIYYGSTTSQIAQSIPEAFKPGIAQRSVHQISSTKPTHPPPRKPSGKVENWLFTLTENVSFSDKPNLTVSSHTDIANRSRCGEKYLNRTTNGTAPEQIYESYVPPTKGQQRQSAPGITTSSSCPLCSHPIGNPRNQHLLKCQYAHDEKEKLEQARKAAEARGQPWR